MQVTLDKLIFTVQDEGEYLSLKAEGRITGVSHWNACIKVGGSPIDATSPPNKEGLIMLHKGEQGYQLSWGSAMHPTRVVIKYFPENHWEVAVRHDYRLVMSTTILD